jgi:hypothetical protein
MTMTPPTTSFREAVADALATITEVADGAWRVVSAPVDAAQPPVFILDWGPDPWRSIQTACVDAVQLEIIVVSARLTPEGNMPVLEAMMDGAVAALFDAALRPYQALSPAPFELGNILYLAARLHIRRPIAIGGQ